MKVLRLFSLTLLLSLMFGFTLINSVKAQENTDLNNVLVEFEQDQITAEDLGIEEPTILPGEGGYWWQNVKENVGLFFTFNAEEKTKKIERQANRRLLEAKKLAEQDNSQAVARAERTLEKYQKLMNKVTAKLIDKPKLREKGLEKFDINHLRRQQIISGIIEKLQNKASENQIQKIKKIRKENTIRWYNVDKEKIQERLEKAIEKNNLGSNFRQLGNIATLEELEEMLPSEALEHIEKAKELAKEKLSNSLESLDDEETEKLEKYIENIKMPTIVKQKFIENLSEDTDLSISLKNTAKRIRNIYAQRLRQEFDDFDDQDKEKFLEEFDDRSHPVYLKILEEIEVPENLSDKIREVKEHQQEQIREEIHQTKDSVKLRYLEQNLRNYPALRKEIQEQRQKVKREEKEQEEEREYEREEKEQEEEREYEREEKEQEEEREYEREEKEQEEEREYEREDERDQEQDH